MNAETGPTTDDRFRHVELEINTACDCACFGCDRFSDVAGKGVPNMTAAQVARFLKESVEESWPWERIRFLGGEPTLHPKFPELMTMLLDYRAHHNPNVFLQVLTNGLGKSAQYRQWLASEKVSLHAEQKEKGVTPIWFHNTRIAPVDRDPDVGELEPCGIFDFRGCGIGLTRHGYFLDGAGASVARVAGLDVGVMRLKDVTWDSMRAQAKVLCRLCGHWNPVGGDKVTLPVTQTGEVTGPYWSEKLRLYNQSRPQLRVYGED